MGCSWSAAELFANGTEVIQPFAPVGGTPNPGQDIGAGEVVLNPGVLLGTDVKGNIVFTYEEWSVSPNDPAFDPDAGPGSHGADR